MEFTKFFQENMNIIAFLLWLFLVMSLICTITMLVTLLIKGDERRKFIVSKSGMVSLIGGIVILILSSVWHMFFEEHLPIGFESHPIIYLGIISIIFNVSYLIFKRKYR